MTGPDDEFEDFLRRRKPVFGRGHDDAFEPPAELDRIVLRQAREAIEAGRPQRMFHGSRWGMPLALAATLLLAFTVILNVGMPDRRVVPEVTIQNIAQQRDYGETALAPVPAAEAAHFPDASAGPANNSPRREVARADTDASAASGAIVVDLGAPTDAPRTDARPARERNAAAAGSGLKPFRGLVSDEEADRYAAAPPAAPALPAARSAADVPAAGGSGAVVTSVTPPPSEAERAMSKAAPRPPFRHDAQTWLAEIDRLRAAGKNAEADAEYAEFKREHRAYAVAPDR